MQIRELPFKPRQFSDLFEEYGNGGGTRLSNDQKGGLEIQYVTNGHLHWEITGHPVLVKPHQVLLTFPWETHRSNLNSEPGQNSFFVVFRVRNQRKHEPQKLRLVDGFELSDLEQREIFSKLSSVRNRCLAAGPNLGWLMNRLSQELTEPSKLARPLVVALSRAVLCELALNTDCSEIPGQIASPSEQRVLEFMATLREECAETWTLDSMADACGLKRTRFALLVKHLTGDTPLRLLERFRIRQTQSQLLKGNMTVTDIAFGGGFNSSQHYSRVFKSLVGCTPSQYRKARGNPAQSTGILCTDSSSQYRKERGNLAAYDQQFRVTLART